MKKFFLSFALLAMLAGCSTTETQKQADVTEGKRALPAAEIDLALVFDKREVLVVDGNGDALLVVQRAAVFFRRRGIADQ